MKADIPSGTLLIAGALISVLVMAFHPTGHELVGAGVGSGQARLNVLVHAMALAAIPGVFLGLLGLARRLSPSGLATAALVAWGFGAVAVLSSAVMSGFVATGVIERMLTADAELRGTYEVLLSHAGLANRGYTSVFVVATSVSILLWAAAILKSRAVPRSAGIAGLVVGVGVLAGFLSGQVGLDVHGFGLITLAQAVWLIWVGVLLCRAPTVSAP